MINLMLVKKDLLRFAGCKVSERDGSRHYRSLYYTIVLCKVKLVGTWIKRREVVDGARSIRSEKLRVHQYRWIC